MLLTRAQAECDVLITMDGSIASQQQIATYRIALVALRARSNRLEDTSPLMPQVLALLPKLAAGTVTVVSSPWNMKKVLFIGWDAADWKAIHPLMDAGRMPHLQRLVETGAMGRVATLQPPLSPMLWTSIATGKRPFKHGIHGFSEPTPDGRSVQPITNLSRTSKAVWNILNQKGKCSVVVGWWPSHPAEPINRGVTVSDHYHKAHRPLGPEGVAGWPLLKGAVHPPELHDTTCRIADAPAGVGRADARAVSCRRWRRSTRRRTGAFRCCARRSAECVSIHSAATWLIDQSRTGISSRCITMRLIISVMGSCSTTRRASRG